MPDWFEKKCREIIDIHVARYGQIPDLAEMSSYLWTYFLDCQNLTDDILLHFKNASNEELKKRLKQKIDLHFS